MGLDQHANLRNQKIDWDDYYMNDNSKNQKVFVWRKHARLQQFMSQKWDEQNEHHEHKGMLSHLGFNADQDTPVYITKEVAEDLADAIATDYKNYVAEDGFFWGQQFQEQAVKEYKAQDKKFIKWAKEQLKEGRLIGYDCSW